jgi:hypothetical protein
MPAFRTAVDIANRALDHCGQDQLSPTLGFSEVSKKATLLNRLYPKLREAELRRNTWRFAIKQTLLRIIDANTMLLTPTLWSSFPTYFVGSIVADQTGTLWESIVRNNLNNQPEIPPVPPAFPTWREYFGPMTAALYSATTTYAIGELVYTTAGNGTYRVYRSLVSANADNPATATAWAATTTYFKNQVVTFSAVPYMSLIDFNLNQTPTGSAAAWSSVTTYALGNAVTGSDGVRYTSIAGGNLNHDPVLTVGFWTNTGILTPWTTVFTGGTGSVKWLQIGGAEFPFGVGIEPLNIIYPLGSGPTSQSTTKNLFRLPAGFLRKAPQDPKAGSVSWFGSPTNRNYDDWLFQDKYIVSMQSDNIPFHFIADTVDVTEMDPMFCEGLAAQIAMQACEPLTQSATKIKVIADFYKLQMGDARTANAIEIGTEEAPLDDYLECRA